MIGISSIKRKAMTKKKFLYTYYKYPPSRFIRWTYANFDMELKNKAPGTMISLSSGVLGTIGLILSDNLQSDVLERISLILIVGWFAMLITLPAFLLNQRRIKKIVRELGITTNQYNVYVKMFVG